MGLRHAPSSLERLYLLGYCMGQKPLMRLNTSRKALEAVAPTRYSTSFPFPFPPDDPRLFLATAIFPRPLAAVLGGELGRKLNW